MHFVVLGVHDADVCPTSNARTRELLREIAPQVPTIAERNHVTIVAGPYVSREHLTVAVVESERAEDLDRFLVESRLAQWNSIRVVPSLPMHDGLDELEGLSPIF